MYRSVLFAVLLFSGAACAESHVRPADGDGGRRGGGDGGGRGVDAGPRPVPDGCVASAETCDGRDNDCDGHFDEGRAATLGCGAGSCAAGRCTCPPGQLCGGRCVDLQRDRRNCGECGGTCGAGLVCDDAKCCTPRARPLDLLFMVDNSNSMEEEQESLSRAFPRLIEGLVSGDPNGDGVEDFLPVTDIHVGVITSDMGTGGFRVPTCVEPMRGDDGVLRELGTTAVMGCAVRYPRFLTFSDQLADDFACVARVGTGGCGFEQQLEAALKAVTPSTSPIRFYLGTTGQGDTENAGFLRPGSVLGVVLVTDENDCSASDPEIFNPMSSTFTGDLNLRCFRYPGAQHPTRRYVDGLLALRPDPGDLVFGVLAGIPPELGGATAGEILAAPSMVERIDPAMMTRVAPSCSVPERGIAFPPRRLVETAAGLEARGGHVALGSICSDDYAPFLVRLAEATGARAGALCGG